MWLKIIRIHVLQAIWVSTRVPQISQIWSISEFKWLKWSLPVSSWFMNVYEPIRIQQGHLKCSKFSKKTVSSSPFGGFHEWGYTQLSSIYRWTFYYKPSIWGYLIPRLPQGASMLAKALAALVATRILLSSKPVLEKGLPGSAGGESSMRFVKLLGCMQMFNN